MKKYWALFLKKLRILSSVSIRLRGVHPKHLVEIREFWVKKHLKKTDVVLDLGCGNGQRDFKIAKFCRKIIGIDYDKRNIKIAELYAKKNEVKNVEFINRNIFSFVGEGLSTLPMGRVEKLSPTRKYDKIILLDVLEHVVERKKLLSCIHSLLKNNGQFLLSVPNKNTSWKKFQKEAGVSYFTDPDHKVEYTQAEIVSELQRAGFKIIEIKPDVIDTSWAPVFDLIGGFSLEMYKKCLKWKRDQVAIHPEEASGWEIVCRKLRIKN